MIVIRWGYYDPPVKVQWGLLDQSEPAPPQAPPTENPIAVLIATAGTAAGVKLAQNQW